MNACMMWAGTPVEGFYEAIDGNATLLAVVAMTTVDLTIWQHTGLRPRFDPVPSEIANIAHLLLKALLEQDTKAHAEAEELVLAWKSRSVQ